MVHDRRSCINPGADWCENLQPTHHQTCRIGLQLSVWCCDRGSRPRGHRMYIAHEAPGQGYLQSFHWCAYTCIYECAIPKCIPLILAVFRLETNEAKGSCGEKLPAGELFPSYFFSFDLFTKRFAVNTQHLRGMGDVVFVCRKNFEDILPFHFFESSVEPSCSGC